MGGLVVLLTLSRIDLATAEGTNLQFKAEFGLKETYDSNVYLQDVAPNPANVAAAKAAGFRPVQPDQSSWVTSLQPKIGIAYAPTSAFRLDASYAPEVTYFHDAPSEDNVAHRGNLDLHGAAGRCAWELLNNAIDIDGSRQGPTFARPDDIPAVGGIPLRDRRAAFLFRNAFRLTQAWEDWFIRPVASSYLHDFQTEQRYIPPALRATTYAYENFIDRQDINGGIDIGSKIAPNTHLVLGYRYGRQDQFKGPYGPGGAIIDSPFDCAYHRVLLGIEGSPVDWLRVTISFGPDIRQFSSAAAQTYPAFQPDELLYYVDAMLTLLPTRRDSIVLKTARFEQPAFTSFSMYQDVKSDAIWRHRFNDAFSASVGFTLWIAQWQPPVHRNDWVYTPNLSLAYSVTKKLTVELASSYDWVDSKIPASVEPLTESHEFTRNLVSLGARYTF
jgi:hypothetical protein